MIDKVMKYLLRSPEKVKPLIEPGIYRHFKGPLYLVAGSSVDCETQEEIVNYIALYGDDFHQHSQPRSRFEEIIETYLLTDGDVVSSKEGIREYSIIESRKDHRFRRVLITKATSSVTPFLPDLQ